VELIGQLRPLIGEGPPVCKLWAKHLDVAEQKQHLASYYVGVAVGTPNRVRKLVQDESITLSNTDLIVIDCEANVKRQTIFTLPETALDLFAFLAVCLKRLGKGKLRIAFC
jgi:protein CMS1